MVVACTAPAPVSSAPSPSTSPQTTQVAATAIASPRPTPAPLVASEENVWAAVRAAMPNAPLMRPTWLPDHLDRKAVAYVLDPPNRYRVAYRPNFRTSDALFFTLGPQPPVLPAPVSALGIRVRGLPAAFEFPANRADSFRVSWREGASELAIHAEEVSGDDLLRIAWSLGLPSPPQPRVRAGACAPSAEAPDAVVRRLFALATSGDAAAVADCWSRDRVADDRGVFAAWAGFGPTSELEIRYVDRIGGRYWIAATFTFARDPTTFQGPHKLLFHQVGIEDGRWRIFETATAVAQVPPFEPKPRILPVAEAFAAVRASPGLPALAPTSLPSGLVGEIYPSPPLARPINAITLRDELHEVVIRLSVAVHNPPPPSARGTQMHLAFRSDPNAFYQVNDATVVTSVRFLMWKEPGTVGCPPCDYLLSSEGLDDATFWSIARSLR